MRPVRLTLQAFGSYAGTLDIDFARLGRHGIFAVTGPTGAGKSTIFDAIVYALYDDLPGFRENGHVRSQFADARTETWVRLDFEAHGRTWRIERAPTQRVCGRRSGEATVEKKSRVLLQRLDAEGVAVPGSVVDRKPRARAEVEDLVGLTKEQFEQVVLIPQGKFEEVLKADTAERAPLLRRLFPVEIFARVTEALKTITASRHDAYEEAKRAEANLVVRVGEALRGVVEHVPEQLSRGSLVNARFGGAGGSPWGTVTGEARAARQAGEAALDGEDLGKYVEEVVGLRLALDGLVDASGEAVAAARVQLDRRRDALARWERWQDDLRRADSFVAQEAADGRELATLEVARRLGDLRGAVAAWNDASEQLRAIEPECDARREAVERSWTGAYDASHLSADAGEAEVRALARRIVADAEALTRESDRFDRISRMVTSLDERETALRRREASLEELEARLNGEEVALGQLLAEIEALGPVDAETARAEVAVEALERELGLARRRVDLGRSVATLAAEAAAAEAEAGRARDELAAARTSWCEGVAGRLAALLVDGEPCPTCGAPEHPSPAVPPESAVGDEELETSQRRADAAEELRHAADRRVAVARAQLAVLSETRDVAVLETELARAQLDVAARRAAAGRADELAAARETRSTALAKDRNAVGAERRQVDAARAVLDGELGFVEAERAGYVAEHGAFVSRSEAAAAHGALAERLDELAEGLARRHEARRTALTCASVLQPVLEEVAVDGPGGLGPFMLESGAIEERSRALDARRALREEVRRRIAEYEGSGAAPERPDVAPFEEAFTAAEAARLDLVRRQAVVAGRAAVVTAAPDLLESAEKELRVSRQALEEARTVASLCAGAALAGTGVAGAGAGGARSGSATARAAGWSGAAKLSLENWVLADYLRQVLGQANVRLASMTGGRYSLQLSDGVTDGRKPWGLDISAFDVHTGQVRPATTFSGGETFMAALALALGLADVVSGGSNRDIGALFVDEGFGSLDPQALDAVLDVLRSLEDGGRVVGVISHVDEVMRALPTGISVVPTVHGSAAEVRYPEG